MRQCDTGLAVTWPAVWHNDPIDRWGNRIFYCNNNNWYWREWILSSQPLSVWLQPYRNATVSNVHLSSVEVSRELQSPCPKKPDCIFWFGKLKFYFVTNCCENPACVCLKGVGPLLNLVIYCEGRGRSVCHQSFLYYDPILPIQN